MKSIVPLIGVLSFLAFIIFVIGIARPRIVRLKKRRHALAAAGFALVVLGFAVDADPPPGEVSQSTGPTILTLWLLVTGVSYAVSRYRTARRRQYPRPLTPDDMNTGTAASATHIATAEIAALYQEKAALSDEVAALKSQLSARLPAKPPSTKKLKPVRTAPAPEAFKAHPKKHRWSSDDRGTTARFTYVDTDGVVTDRIVANWVSDGPYIRGWCLDRQASRTFRKDRIEDWQV